MTLYGWPIVYVLFVWWFSTGIIILANQLPARTFVWSFLGATAVLFAAVAGLFATRDSGTATGAYCGFSCGLLVWAWTQLTFYNGYITGPRRQACAPGCDGVRHFWHAVQTCLYHELVCLGFAAFIFAVSWKSVNHSALWTYVILWVMHLSAKLNVVFGVRNLNEQFFPPHLKYLGSFLKQRPINALFPFSVTIATVFVALVGLEAFSAAQSPRDTVAATFYFLLLALAILEHWFLILPIPAEALWAWAVRTRDRVTVSKRTLSAATEMLPESPPAKRCTATAVSATGRAAA